MLLCEYLCGFVLLFATASAIPMQYLDARSMDNIRKQLPSNTGDTNKKI